MKKTIKTILTAGLFMFAVVSPITALATPQSVSAASKNCERSFLGIPPWYRGLTKQDENPSSCDIKTPGSVEQGSPTLSAFIWLIVLNVIQMAIVAVAYVASFFILYGGFLFLTGGAVPGQIENARKTILNAVIGLVIAMSALVLTNLVFQIIK